MLRLEKVLKVTHAGCITFMLVVALNKELAFSCVQLQHEKSFHDLMSTPVYFFVSFTFFHKILYWLSRLRPWCLPLLGPHMPLASIQGR